MLVRRGAQAPTVFSERGKKAGESRDRSSIGHQPCRPLCRLRAYLINHVSILPVPSARHSRSRVATASAEHKRHEVQAFGYNEAIHRLEPFGTAEAFVEFLGITEELLPEATNKKIFTFDKFVQTANAIADSMHERESLLSLYLTFLTKYDLNSRFSK